MERQESTSFIICGQVLTGRLETVEAYFIKRFPRVYTIGISSLRANYNGARFSAYTHGKKCFEMRLFNLLIKSSCLWEEFLFAAAYGLYALSIFIPVLIIGFFRVNACFLGIGFFPAAMGVVLKRLRLVKKTIYYSIDYFPPVHKRLFDRIFVRLDALCARSSDFVWVITPKILQAREEFGHCPRTTYRYEIVPLCFDDSLLRFRDPLQVEPRSIVFVGTSGYLHGLELLVEAAPRLVTLLPDIRIKIIGPGPWRDLQSAIQRHALTKYFDFLGFIDDDARLFNTVSGFAVGVALYRPIASNPSLYADPGKPKLYAFCAVPVVISKTPPVWEEIERAGAGKAIDFDREALVKAIFDILSDTDTWNRYRRNAYDFARRYTSEKVFGSAIGNLL